MIEISCKSECRTIRVLGLPFDHWRLAQEEVVVVYLKSQASDLALWRWCYFVPNEDFFPYFNL
jgi:hypothetical protein